MIKTLTLSLLLLLASCLPEDEGIKRKIPKSTNSTASDTSYQTFKSNKDGSEFNDSVNRIQNKGIKKNNGSKYLKFYSNNGEDDSLYRIKPMAITFFLKNQQQEELKEFRKANFPMEWWATGMCSYYPLPSDSVEYFLKLARNMGYKDYGFDCEKVNNENFQAALSNKINIQLQPGVEIEEVLLEFGLELIYSSKNRRHQVRTVNLSADRLLRRIKKLNKSKKVTKASHCFMTCEETPVDRL